MLKIEDQYQPVLAKAAIFAGIKTDALIELLTGLDAFVRKYEAGRRVRRAGDGLDYYPVVLAGSLQVTLLQGGENRKIAEFNTGDSFAEAIAAGDSFCPVDIWVIKDAAILGIPVAKLDSSNHPLAAKIRSNITKEISKKVLLLSQTLQVIGEPRLADRIMVYLRNLPKNPDGSVTVPLSRKDWANYLRVSDKSLIRELRSMAEDGELLVDGRNIKIVG